MEFEWDSIKSERNRRERGLGFEVAIHALNQVIENKADHRQDYGEKRMLAKCRHEDEILMIVYTMREGLCRIISVRRANKRERRGIL